MKCQCRKIAEVPFSFGVRVHGESKLTGAVIVRYLQQLGELYRYQFGGLLRVLLLLFVLLAAAAVYMFVTRRT